MAKSRFEYVRLYEEPDACLRNTFIVVRIDGRGFHKFSDAHGFDKPNDLRALRLMDVAARAVMDEFADAVLAFGESDEYSFLLRRSTALYNRRRSKINSAVCSVFTAHYVMLWPTYFPGRPLAYAPSFDSRVVLYPAERDVRDYFAWRQADTHINNLYNTAFWALVQSGESTRDAHKALQGTESKDKNELLFARFGINYNTVDPMFRKGSTCVRAGPARESATTAQAGAAVVGTSGARDATMDAGTSDAVGRPVDGAGSAGVPGVTAAAAGLALADARTDAEAANSADEPGERDESVVALADETGARRDKRDRPKSKKPRPYDGTSGPIEVLHVDIIRDAFWAERPWLLA